MHAVRLRAATVTVVAGLTVSVALGHETGPPKREIAFTRGQGILLVDPDSGVERRVATGLGGVACSPDGSSLAFVRARPDSHRGDDVYVVAASGGRPKRLTNSRSSAETDVTWSRDGRWLAYGRGALIGSYDLWLVNADGSGRRRITARTGSEARPAWAPDGRRIAFEAYASRRKQGGVFVASIARRTLRRLSAGRALEGSAAWSVRNRIAYTSWRRDVSTIYAVNPDGSGRKRVARVRGSMIDDLAWSPDGRRLAFDANGIYVVDANGNHLVKLTHNGFGPIWSPDGTQIAFTRAWDVWVMNADGTNQRRAAADGGVESVACWLPLGAATRPRGSLAPATP